jgi:hypothetical protein
MKSLKDLMQKRNVKPVSLSEKDIFYIFQRVIKEEFGNVGAGKLTADFFKNKTIFVKAKNAAWGGELFSNRSSIIRKINKKLGEEAIREIKLK